MYISDWYAGNNRQLDIDILSEITDNSSMGIEPTKLSPEESEALLTALVRCLKSNDLETFITALRGYLRGTNKSELAKGTGLNRDTLYSAIKPGSDPRLSTVAKILHHLTNR